VGSARCLPGIDVNFKGFEEEDAVHPMAGFEFLLSD